MVGTYGSASAAHVLTVTHPTYGGYFLDALINHPAYDNLSAGVGRNRHVHQQLKRDRSADQALEL